MKTIASLFLTLLLLAGIATAAQAHGFGRGFAFGGYRGTYAFGHAFGFGYGGATYFPGYAAAGYGYAYPMTSTYAVQGYSYPAAPAQGSYVYSDPTVNARLAAIEAALSGRLYTAPAPALTPPPAALSTVVPADYAIPAATLTQIYALPVAQQYAWFGRAFGAYADRAFAFHGGRFEGGRAVGGIHVHVGGRRR